jgi:hypothetical protein
MKSLDCDLGGGSGYVFSARAAVWHGWLAQPW